MNYVNVHDWINRKDWLYLGQMDTSDKGQRKSAWLTSSGNIVTVCYRAADNEVVNIRTGDGDNYVCQQSSVH